MSRQGLATDETAPAPPPDAAAAAERRAERRRLVCVAFVVALLGGILLAIRTRVFFPLGSPAAGSRIGNLGLAIQLGALLAGVITINLTSGRTAQKILAAEGAICLAALGLPGLAYAAGLVAWYFALSARWLGRARPLAALLLLVAMNACAWGPPEVSAAAYMFSLMFTMRFLVLTWDRWQNDFAPMAPLDYMTYALAPPLIIVPPYMGIIPFFSGFSAKIRPGMTSERARRAARHIGLAFLFGGLRVAMHFIAAPESFIPLTYWKFLLHVIEAVIFAHLMIPLLSLHGIEERLPLFRPLLTTRFVQFWTRFQVHLKDAQVFLFYTPALLRLRRMNRYAAIILATTWTMMVGNTVIHIAARYCFLPSVWGRVRWVLLANVIMTIALSADMCYDEWRSRRRMAGAPEPAPPRHPKVRLLLGWFVTQVLAVVATSL